MYHQIVRRQVLQYHQDALGQNRIADGLHRFGQNEKNAGWFGGLWY